MLKYKKVIIIGLVLLTLSFSTATYSRYVINEETDNTMASLDGFYFDSNYLKTSTIPTYVISNYEQDEYITIELYNYIDELKFSTSDITYSVVTDIGIETENIIIGEWVGGDLKTSDLKIKIPSNYFVNGKVSFRVTATTTLPYVVSSSAIFTVYEALKYSDATTSIHDEINSFTVVYSIDTQGMEGGITITHPSTITPDKTDNRIYDITDTSFKINVEKNSVYDILFFKDLPTDIYKVNIFNKFDITK